MKTLDEVIAELYIWDTCDKYPESFYNDEVTRDALHYLKEYRKQKYIWKKLYQLFYEMFWGLEEEYPLDGERIVNLFFDAYSKGFDNEDLG